MIVKKLIGQIMTDMGFITKQELEDALSRQREIFEEKVIPERVERVSLVTESRLGISTDGTPLLGKILLEMGFATEQQLREAMKKQETMGDLYRSLESEKLGLALEIGTIVNSTLNLAEVLALIMRHANRVTDSCASTLMLLDDKTGELVFSIPTGPKASELTDFRLPPGEGIAGWVVEHEQPALVPKAREDPRFYPGIDIITGIETETLLCVPLKARTRLIGVLEVINKADGTPFNEKDALLLSIFACQAAMAIENARLHGELKDRLEESRRMQMELTQSEKFRALGQMSSGVAHDFNNILGAIIGYGELAIYDTQEDLTRQSLEQVLKASNRAKELVRQILTFSRQSKQKKIPIRSDQIVKEALKLLRASLPSIIEIREDIAAAAGIIRADPTQIHQVLLNLCTNAHHAMSETGGVLGITLASVALKDEDVSTLPDIEPGRYVRLSVSDTGHGMDSDTISQIFDPYFTTKEKGVGTGMGLAVVLGITRSHGGAIRVFSELNKGTTFDVFFPVVDTEIQYEGEPLGPLPSGRERILFVDDEDALAELGRQMLERLGYRVTSGINPIQALETFRGNPNNFDLVVTDMTMPGMTGDELARELMKIRPDTPVILCTGFSERITAEKAKEMGIKELAMKPLVMKDLATTIRKALDR